MKKKDEEGVVALTIEQLSHWAFNVPDKIVDGQSVERTARFDKAPLVCMQSTDDAWCLSGDRNPDTVRRSHPGKNIVSLVRMFFEGTGRNWSCAVSLKSRI